MKLSDLQTLDSPSTFLTKWHQNPQNGLFKLVSKNNVVWHVAVCNNRVHYATHSLNSSKTLEFYLQTLGYEEAIIAGKHLLKNYQQTVEQRSTSLSPIYLSEVHCIQTLEHQGILSNYQANHLVDTLAKDSLETALWETSGTVKQIAPRIEAESPLLSWTGVHFPSLVQTLQQRQQTWRKIADVIQSPYQRPYCKDVSRIHEAGLVGSLPIATLKLLVRLMTGRSIRQIAQILKQDELKFAQLLSPYVRQGIVRIQAPSPPFARLSLSSTSLRSAHSGPLSTEVTSRERISSLASHQPTSILPRTPPRFSFPPPSAPGSHKIPDSSSTDTASSIASAPRYKIVCIDDNTSMLEMLENYLGSGRFEVTTVENPMESISALFASRPDLVLMDVSMPGINGHRLCQILKRSSAFKKTPIIMVSGNTSALDKAKAISMGATDYLEKPFSKKALLNVVNTYLKAGVSLALT